MIDVVVAADVLVAAASRIDPDFVRFPAVPPSTGSASRDVLGVFNYPKDGYFSLVLSDALAVDVAVGLVELGWAFDARDRFVQLLYRLADDSGGGLVTESAAPVPEGLAPGAVRALRCAASADLGDEREVVAVTEDPDAAKLDPWSPHTPGWPTGRAVMVMSPQRFRDLAVRVRLRLRRSR